MHITISEYRYMQDNLVGKCTSCGEERDGCEPDARGYHCEGCGLDSVDGCDEWLMRGDVIGDPPAPDTRSEEQRCHDDARAAHERGEFAPLDGGAITVERRFQQALRAGAASIMWARQEYPCPELHCAACLINMAERGILTAETVCSITPCSLTDECERCGKDAD